MHREVTLTHREPCFLLRQVRVKGIRIRPSVNARCPHSACWAKRVRKVEQRFSCKFRLTSFGFSHMHKCFQLTARASQHRHSGGFTATSRSVCTQCHPLCNCLLASSLFSFICLSAYKKVAEVVELLFLFFRGMSTSLNDWFRLPHYNCSHLQSALETV